MMKVSTYGANIYFLAGEINQYFLGIIYIRSFSMVAQLKKVGRDRWVKINKNRGYGDGWWKVLKEGDGEYEVKSEENPQTQMRIYKAHCGEPVFDKR